MLNLPAAYLRLGCYSFTRCSRSNKSKVTVPCTMRKVRILYVSSPAFKICLIRHHIQCFSHFDKLMSDQMQSIAAVKSNNYFSAAMPVCKAPSVAMIQFHVLCFFCFITSSNPRLTNFLCSTCRQLAANGNNARNILKKRASNTRYTRFLLRS